MLKLEALQRFEDGDSFAGSRLPSVLLKSTGKSRQTHKTLDSQKEGTIEAMIHKKTKELGLQSVSKSELGSKDEAKRKMGLDEFLARFTSEDNASFQELHDLQNKKFLAQLAWMNRESDQYKKLNQLALEQG